MFAFPPESIVDRLIPKTKILANARPSPRQKRLLTDQIHQIRWRAKLSPESIRLPSVPEVPEIQIFQLALKDSSIEFDLLQFLDKAIPQPLFFLLEAPDGKSSIAAAHKRPSESDRSQWVVGPRFATEFDTPASSPQALPAAADLGQLYRALFAPLLPLAAKEGESLTQHVQRCEQYQSLQKKVEQAKARISKEKQFNRKVELNRELRDLRSTLEHLEK